MGKKEWCSGEEKIGLVVKMHRYLWFNRPFMFQ
jgi:hypothetical protein